MRVFFVVQGLVEVLEKIYSRVSLWDLKYDFIYKELFFSFYCIES